MPSDVKLIDMVLSVIARLGRADDLQSLSLGRT